MADLFRASWRTSVDDIVQSFHLVYEQTAGASTATTAQSAAVAIQAHQLAALQAILAQDARVESIYVRKISGGTIPAWKGNLQAANGTHVDPNAISAQNCLLINLRNLAGLLKRSGRLFISGCPHGQLTDGVWDPAFLNGPVFQFMDTLEDVPAGGTDGWAGSLRVLRTYIDGVKQVPPVVVDVDSVDSTTELGTQHARKGELTGFRIPAP